MHVNAVPNTSFKTPSWGNKHFLVSRGVRVMSFNDLQNTDLLKIA